MLSEIRVVQVLAFAPILVAAIPARTTIEEEDSPVEILDHSLQERDDEEDDEDESQNRATPTTKTTVPTSTSYGNNRPGKPYEHDSGYAVKADSYAMKQESNSASTIEPVVKIDRNHTKMELGIAFGVLTIFLIFGCFVFFYYRMKSSGKKLKLPGYLNRFRREKDVENLGQQTDYFRQPVHDASLPKKPEPVLNEKSVLENARSSRSPSPSSRRSRGSTSSAERRRTRDLQPMIMSSSPPKFVERTLSQRSDRSVRTGLPVGGPKLPRIPSQARVNPFADQFTPNNPFVDDDDARSIHSTSSCGMAPAPLRLKKSDPSLKKSELNRADSTMLVLTDPRVADNRILKVANRTTTVAPILQPPPPPRNATKNPIKRLQGEAPFLHLPVSPKQGLDSRFSWTTKSSQTPAQSNFRKSNVSSSSTDSAPHFRGVNDWVNHQSKRLVRHPSEVPEDAKTVTDYDVRSDNTGIDTRRTYYQDM